LKISYLTTYRWLFGTPVRKAAWSQKKERDTKGQVDKERRKKKTINGIGSERDGQRGKNRVWQTAKRSNRGKVPPAPGQEDREVRNRVNGPRQKERARLLTYLPVLKGSIRGKSGESGKVIAGHKKCKRKAKENV